MTFINGKNDMRCPVCLTEWLQEAMMKAGVKGCPRCGTSLQPLKISEDGYVRVNWQDLRMLAIYAERWSAMFDLGNKGNLEAIKALQNIIANLRRHQPKNSLPLTMPNTIIVMKGNVAPPRRVGDEIRPRHPEPPKIRIETDKTLGFNKDHTGMIPSPFYRKQ